MLSSLSQVGSNKSSPYFSIHKTFGTFLDVFLIFPDSRIDTKGLQESGAHHRGRVHAEDISDLKSAQFFRQTSAWGKILVMAREGEIIRLRQIPDRRIFFSPE